MPYTGSDTPAYVPKAKRKQWVAIWNSVYSREKKDGKSDKDAEASAFRQANGVTGKATEQRFSKLLRKADEDIGRQWADAVIRAIEENWATLPAEVRESLQSSMTSGIGQGMVQLESADTSLIASANRVAQEYAVNRAAELVGMKYDDDGNLIPNPNAKWAISDTTRERIREIVTESFAEDTPMAEIRDDIQEALRDEATGNGIFSEGRAAMIARTEVMRAQVGGNFNVWLTSGLVKSTRWLTSEDEKVCEICMMNDRVVRDIGKAFPSGHIMPGEPHPLDRCVLVVEELNA